MDWGLNDLGIENLAILKSESQTVLGANQDVDWHYKSYMTWKETYWDYFHYSSFSSVVLNCTL